MTCFYKDCVDEVFTITEVSTVNYCENLQIFQRFKIITQIIKSTFTTITYNIYRSYQIISLHTFQYPLLFN